MRTGEGRWVREMRQQKRACMLALGMSRKHKLSKGWADTTGGGLGQFIYLHLGGMFSGYSRDLSRKKAVALTAGGRYWGNDERD